jgi:hypothetical protein
MTLPPLNEGDRLSRFTLDRYATGELSEDAEDDIRRQLAGQPAARAHLEAIDHARSAHPRVDIEAIRARVRNTTGAPPALPAPANRPANAWIASAFLVAAVLFVGVLGVLQSPQETHTTTLRSKDVLLVYQLRDNQLHRYGGDALRAGDVVGFKVATAGRDSVVLLSVDGAGQVSIFYPDAGETPLDLSGDDLFALPGSIILDAAPGPEFFVAVFDTSVPTARSAAKRAWQTGGEQGLRDWIRSNPNADGVALERR